MSLPWQPSGESTLAQLTAISPAREPARCTGATTANAGRDNLYGVSVAPEQAELVRIEQLRLRALVDADVAVAERIHADDFQLITPGGDAYSKEQYLGDIASGVIDYRVWEPLDIEVHVIYAD